MKLHEGNVFPSARIAICGSNSLILVYFLDNVSSCSSIILHGRSLSIVYFYGPVQPLAK